MTTGGAKGAAMSGDMRHDELDLSRDLSHDDAHDNAHDEVHDRGLGFDLSTLLRRRGMLGLLAGAGLTTLVGCGDGSSGPPTAGGSTAAASADGGSCARIAQETAGPYPGDGSNGPNVLTSSGIVRSDIRSSFGSASGVAAGVPLVVNLTIRDSAKGCSVYAGAAVYLWQCDAEGRYSMYSRGVTDENYLRGVQEAGADGVVRFTSVFPAAYSGRWPHIHFEVYPTLAAATATGNKITTSQLALPEAACRTAYATDAYRASAGNLSQTSLATDNVFRDGSAGQLASVTGDVASGFTASLAVTV